MEEERVRLADQIKSKKRKSLSYELTEDRTAPEVARFLFKSNGYIKKAVKTTKNAIVRPGFNVKAQTARDQKVCDSFRYENDLNTMVDETVFNAILHGYQFWEMYDDSEIGPAAAMIPIDETDYLRNESQEVIFEKNGKPKGVTQERDGLTIAEWKYGELAHFYFDKLHAADLGHAMIEPAVVPAKEYGYIRNNIGDSFIRSMPVVHMIVEGGTGEDIEEVSESLGTQFTAETVYVTSERYQIDTKSTTAYNIEVFNFTEPLMSEIASAFNMPIELLGSTKHLKSDDFPDRYIEWIEDIKEMQEQVANVLERKVFNRITKKPVEVTFNNPAAITPENLLKQVGFAKQSEAIDENKAKEILENSKIIV